MAREIERELDHGDVMDDREEALEQARANEIVNEWIAGYKTTLYGRQQGFHDIIMCNDLTASQEVSNLFLKLVLANNEEETHDAACELRGIILKALDKAAEDKIEEDNWRIE